jgi:hypothetical protein
MDVSAFFCVVLSCVSVEVGPITRPRSPTNFLKDSQVKTLRHRKVKADD